MSLHNINQVLLRNSELLNASSPLLINLPVDGFLNEYKALHPKSDICYYSSNFEYFLAANKLNSIKTAEFAAQYRSEKKHDLLVIAFPKSKAELNFTIAMLADSLEENAMILVVGEKKSGINSLQKLTATTISCCNKIDSARHCVLFAGTIIAHEKPFKLEDWYKYYQLDVAGVSLKIASLPGVFSQSELDVGTKLLLEQLPDNLKGSVLDFGCGAGVIASFVAKKNKEADVSLVDVNALALSSAEKTLAINNLNGKCYASNSLSHVKDKYDHILSNPPFHQGIKTNYLATETFLHNIKAHIKPRGTITLVANSFLKYQPIMEQCIAKTKQLTKAKGFSVYFSSIN